MSERINHPTYYGGDTRYEAIKVIEAWQLGFCLGNTVKYISRARKKSPEAEIEDLKKAAWYLNREIVNREQGLQVAAKVADYQTEQQNMRLPDVPEVPQQTSSGPVLAEVGKV